MQTLHVFFSSSSLGWLWCRCFITTPNAVSRLTAGARSSRCVSICARVGAGRNGRSALCNESRAERAVSTIVSGVVRTGGSGSTPRILAKSSMSYPLGAGAGAGAGGPSPNLACACACARERRWASKRRWRRRNSPAILASRFASHSRCCAAGRTRRFAPRTQIATQLGFGVVRQRRLLFSSSQLASTNEPAWSV